MSEMNQAMPGWVQVEVDGQLMTFPRSVAEAMRECVEDARARNLALQGLADALRVVTAKGLASITLSDMAQARAALDQAKPFLKKETP